MLVNIRVENFKSFDQPVELSMISSTKIRAIPEHRIRIKGANLLRHAVIYGANASGKTNLVDFLRFFKTCVEAGIPIESTRMFCRNRRDNKNRESSFEIQFSADNNVYAYGFSIILSQRRVTGEWLYELHRNGTTKCIFEREGGQRPCLDDSVRLNVTDKKKFTTYAEDFEDNTSSLFLTEMNRNKKFSENSKLIVFRTVYDWFHSHLIVLTPDTPVNNFSYYYDDDSLTLVNQMIKTFDTGITSVRIEEINMEELANRLPRPVFDSVLSVLREKMEISDTDEFRMSMRIGDSFYSIELSADAKSEPRVTTLRLRHGKSFFDFNFEDESDGTRRLFELLDMLLTKEEDIVFIVDELERSLHPKLTQHFIELFTKLHQNRQIQLIFSTHESTVMDQSLFRRDEIWFIERNADNSSTLYSLDRFKERYDKTLGKAYLDGRYGAIPVFSSFEFSGEEIQCRQ